MATILKFPDTQNLAILPQHDADDLFEVLDTITLELHNRLDGLTESNPKAAMRLTVHDYHLLASTLLMDKLASEHRIAILEQNILDLEAAVFGGEE